MMIQRSTFLPLVALAAAALASCSDVSNPSAPRSLSPRGRSADVVLTKAVRFNTTYGFIEVDGARIAGASLSSDQVITVSPGQSFQLSGIFDGNEFQCPSSPCTRTAFLAFTQADLPAIPVSWTYDAHTAVDEEVFTDFEFGVSVTAPTTPGTYYVGLRDIAGSATDNGAGSLGVDETGSNGTGAIAEIIVAPPPVVQYNLTGTAGLNGWYTSAVGLTWTVSDSHAPIADQSGCDAETFSTDGVFTTSCSATSIDGSTTTPVTIYRDATPPSISGTVSPNPIAFGAKATATPIATDATSGVASKSCGTVVTSAAGTFTVTCTATDNAGNTASTDVQYTVNPLAFSGFLGSINTSATAFNATKAGSSVSLNFSLGGDLGLSILADRSPTMSVVPCPGEVGIPSPARAIGDAGSLKYSNGIYTYVWKTDKRYAGLCMTVDLKLQDGVDHTANFQFK